VRKGFTLVEVLVSTLLALVLLAMVIQLFLSGARLFGMGIEAARGPEAAIMLMDRFEEDLAQVIQAPGDPRPPMVVTKKTRVTFYRASKKLSNPLVAVGEPASWGLEERKDGLFHPVRDGKPLTGIVIAGWELEVLAPDEEQNRAGWYLAARVRFPPSSRLGREFVSARLVFLPQPSTNFLNFLAFGAELLPGTVSMLPRPEGDEDFEKLGPPDISAETIASSFDETGGK
jgi:prepilin-type N-terminal cleavage/methylation domain-containing protein